jgi:phosphate:Na+ symporter
MELSIILAKIFAGLALLLFSISQLSNTLKKMAGSRLKNFLQNTTNNPVKGMSIGAAATFLVQSSSVTVLLLLGLVNAGIMNLKQAIFVMLGSEIGTTITAQIVAFKVTFAFYPLILFGFALKTIVQKENYKNSGEIVFCIGLIFLSMAIMSDGSKPLKEYPLLLESIRVLGIYPIWGIFLGALLTAITSSSSATTSMVIAMSMEGVIDLPSGIALIIGANIGTCVLELIATAGTNAAAKRTGMAQFIINLLGAVIFYPFLRPFAELVATTAHDLPRNLANAHTIFNLTVSLLLMPFVGLLVLLLEKIIPSDDRGESDQVIILDEKFLAVPALALYEAETEVNRMASLTEEMLQNAQKALLYKDADSYKIVQDNEKAVDNLNEKVNNYLNKISVLTLSRHDRNKKRALAHAITDIERIADLAENLAGYSVQKEVVFSDKAILELERIFINAFLTYSAAAKSLRKKQKSLAKDVSFLEREADELERDLRTKYLTWQEDDTVRLRKDALYPRILNELERICAHAGNIAESVLKM